ncbi:MAG: type II toxin-antitoxin system RelE/ParE family toxin [Arenicella sp.]|jgi:hypothetical protein|nr:type II toxin-antitoxin system RelE/ParE family toxin [Arenicella sp.]
MRIFKNKAFDKWASKEGLSDDALREATEQIEHGLIGVALGGNVFKKRVGLTGRGKRGGARTLLVYRGKRRAFLFTVFLKM